MQNVIYANDLIWISRDPPSMFKVFSFRSKSQERFLVPLLFRPGGFGGGGGGGGFNFKFSFVLIFFFFFFKNYF